MYCEVCGNIDEDYDENAISFHNDTPKHICNLILANYKNNKRYFSKNRDGLFVLCSAESLPHKGTFTTKIENCDHHKVRIYVKPKQKVKFWFSISNDLKNDDVLIVGVQLAHPQPQFQMNDHPFIFGSHAHILKKKTSVENEISVSFSAEDIGQYEMPIMFTFHKASEEKNIIFVRELVVMVEEKPVANTHQKSPYTNQDWEHADHFLRATNAVSKHVKYNIPRLLKTIFSRGLEEKGLETLQLPSELMAQLRTVLISTRAIFDQGLTKENYMLYFHNLLWWEETIARINLKKYNMADVNLLQKDDKSYWLEVPGLAEKRPSLLRGDRVILRFHEKHNVLYETTIKDIGDTSVQLSGIDPSFHELYNPDQTFDVRFLLSRVPQERMHEAVGKVFDSKQESRIFPVASNKKKRLVEISRFYNSLISRNEEQRSAVHHIVTGTSGRAPYIVFGPPGTGKTMTIVEAIIQIVVRNPRNRVLVCTDSNMAADHIAVTLLKYNKVLNISQFILRANSRYREWNGMPSALAPVSNGTSHDSFYPITNTYASSFRILVTTLLHAAKYCSSRNQANHKLQMTHLFIDEAAQAAEPAQLVPITGLLAPNGQLVLAGDPLQLGPVCVSRQASDKGLGMSLMERLKVTYDNLYEKDPNYITMLVKNFRSNSDILKLPNELFYDNCLQALASADPLSNVSILGCPGGQRAIVFHAVNSREQRMGKSPSYFNEKELDMLKRYTKALIEKHNVAPKDIGIIAPYIRQVYKMKGWLSSEKYDDIEVGAVESFQGKEKRVILVSTVRANCRLLDYDARYSLGFLVDDKRYNVTLTRAKAKLIIIGNPACLTRDAKWRRYMDLCKEFGCYFGQDTEQMERNSNLLIEVARTRFDKCRLTDALHSSLEAFKQKKKKT